MKTVTEMKKAAKAYRKTTSRSDLGKWKVQKDRPEVKELILAQEETRVKELIPIRHERMAASPFAFFRGAAVLQAHDLSHSPGTIFSVQACGDAHIANFGIFASPERRLVFDITDFDETLPAPFETDIKRLAASIEICGREKKLSKDDRASAVYEAAAMYRKTMAAFSDMGNMEVWYRHLDLEKVLETNSETFDEKQKKLISQAISKALSKNSEQAMEKLTETVDGKIRIKSAPPMIVPLRDLIGEERERNGFQHNIHDALDKYAESLPASIRRLISQYEPIELAHKVVGVGSVGMKAWILVMMGREDGDPLVLQIKQAGRSVLEPYYGKSAYERCGERIVEGQHMIQTAGDILLGWLRFRSESGKVSDYYVRQLWDSKGSADLLKLPREGFDGLSLMCAWTLAHAHAKTGDRHAIAGYLGKNDSFETAMVKYAQAYADQNEEDYRSFLKFAGS